MPVTCESCQDKHGLYTLIPYCAWCDSHYITAHLGMFMPVTCESCQDKHGLHVLLPYCASCASYCIRAEVGMHAPVMLTATRNNMDCMFSYQTVPGLPAVAAARLGFGWPYGGAGHHAVKCCIPLGSWLTCEESWPANRYNEQFHSDIALNIKTKLFKEANKCIQKHNTDFFFSNFYKSIYMHRGLPGCHHKHFNHQTITINIPCKKIW